MQGIGPDMTKSLGKAPRTRTCYICGRGYGLSSFEIHLKQCKELWVKREEQKPKNERKPLPEDPFLHMSGGGGSGLVGGGQDERGFGSPGGRGKGGSGGGSGGEHLSAAQLEAMNAAAQNSYNDVALFKCDWCGRSFLEEKLKIHNRSCTQEKPARRADQKVKMGKPEVKLSSPSSGPPLHASAEPTPPSHRPKTTGSSRHQSHKLQIDEIDVSRSSGGGGGLPMHVAGNIGGGLASQSKSQSHTSPRGQRLPQNQAPREGGSLSKEEKLHLALSQLHDLEEANLLMTRSINDLKHLIYDLQND